MSPRPTSCERPSCGRDLLRRQRRHLPHPAAARRGARLWQPGPRARAVAARLRRGRARRPAGGLQEPGEGGERRAARPHSGAGLRGSRPHHDPHPGSPAAPGVRGGGRPVAGRRRRALLRPRPEHPLRPHPAAGRSGRRHGRAEGPGSPGPPPVQRGPRRPGAGRRGAGRDRPRAGARALLRGGHRRHPGRGAEDHVQGGDGDRPVRRAGGAVRRRLRAASRPGSPPWSRPATSPRRPTSSACTR